MGQGSNSRSSGAPTSPKARFSWSGGAQGDRERERSTPVNQSIFGTGGLRGSRRGNTPANSGNLSSSRSIRDGSYGGLGGSSHPANSPPRGGAGGIDEDDDPPPIEGLTETIPSSFNNNSFSSPSNNHLQGQNQSSSPARFGASTSNNQIDPDTSFNPFIVNNQNVGNSPSNNRPGSYGVGNSNNNQSNLAPSSQRSVVLYGFPSSLSQAVLEHFSNMGEVESSSLFNPLDPSSTNVNGGGVGGVESMKLVYLQPWSALRAVRRSGEIVAGTCFVGVRFLDEGLNREAVLNGVTSNFFAGVGGNNSTMTTSNSSSNLISNTTTNGSSSSSSNISALSGTGTGLGGRTLRDSTPTFGIPISVVGTPGAGLKSKSATQSPAVISSNNTSSRMANLLGSGSSTPNRSNGIIGSVATPPANVFNSNNNSPAVNGKEDGKSSGGNGGIRGRIENAIFGW